MKTCGNAAAGSSSSRGPAASHLLRETPAPEGSRSPALPTGVVSSPGTAESFLGPWRSPARRVTFTLYYVSCDRPFETMSSIRHSGLVRAKLRIRTPLAKGARPTAVPSGGSGSKAVSWARNPLWGQRCQDVDSRTSAGCRAPSWWSAGSQPSCWNPPPPTVLVPRNWPPPSERAATQSKRETSWPMRSPTAPPASESRGGAHTPRPRGRPVPPGRPGRLLGVQTDEHKLLSLQPAPALAAPPHTHVTPPHAPQAEDRQMDGRTLRARAPRLHPAPQAVQILTCGVVRLGEQLPTTSLSLNAFLRKFSVFPNKMLSPCTDRPEGSSWSPCSRVGGRECRAHSGGRAWLPCAKDRQKGSRGVARRAWAARSAVSSPAGVDGCGGRRKVQKAAGSRGGPAAGRRVSSPGPDP